MIRLLFRAIGWLALASAFIAVVIDGARSIAADELRLTQFGSLLAQVLGARFAALQPMIERNVSPLLWDPVIVRFFALPVFAAFGFIGIFLILTTGRKPPAIGFSSRP